MQENGSHEPSAKGWSQSGQEGKANVNMVAHDIQKTAERREPGVPQLHLGVTALGAWLAQRTPLHDRNLKVTAVQGKLSGSFSGM